MPETNTTLNPDKSTTLSAPRVSLFNDSFSATGGTPINSTTIAPQAPLNVPQPQQQSTPSIDFENIISGFTVPSTEERKSSDLQDMILSSLKTLGTEKTKQSELEGVAGLPEQRTQLQGVIGQLQGLQKEAAAIPLQIQQESAGRGVTAGGVAPVQTERLRENAIKSLGLAAIGQTLQGNISLAEASIARAIDLEFEPERIKLQTLGKLYEFNKDALERSDKKRADALSIALTERARVLEETKAEKTFASTIMLEAARAGAPQNVLETIRNSTPDKAIELASSYLGADFKAKAEQQAFDNNIKLRTVAASEYANNLTRRKNLIELASLGDKQAIQELGYDPQNLPLTPKELALLEDQKGYMNRDIDITNRALNNNVGLQVSSGLLQGGVGGAFLETPGGILGAVTGIGSGYAASKKQDFLSDASYIVKNLTFQKIKELGDQGVKLTPISEKELKAMGDASSVLVSAARFDEGGNLTGFNMSENRVREQLKLVAEHYQKAKEDIVAQQVLTNSDIDEINNIK